MKRYNATGDYTYPVEEDIDGEFVRYEDAKAEINSLKEANSKLAEAAIISEGYVLVPKEPTEKMVDAFWNTVEVGNEAKLIDVFTAMINAAQDEEPEV